MSSVQIATLFLAAVAAGAINSVAGGGSFISFPALLLAGVPPISANATNATALWPGTVASVGAYRRELAVQRRGIVLFSAISLLGGLIGALLLLQTQERTFEQLIPYLLLAATLIFALSPRITRWTRQWGEHGRERWSRRLVVLALRSEEHTSELQSRPHLVCRLLLEKKNHRTKAKTPTQNNNRHGIP